MTTTNEAKGAAMKSLYLIVKYSGRGWGFSPPHPHQVFATKKAANARCKELNAKAQYYNYEVVKVANGDIKEQ